MSAMIKTSIFLILCVIVSSSSNLKSKLLNIDKDNRFKRSGACHARACSPAEKGGIIPGSSFEYRADKANIKVYRIFTDPLAKGKASKYGSWWSLSNPSGKKSDYMTRNAICPEWNDMTHLVVCELKVGTLVSVGPTQSAKCPNGSVIRQNMQNLQVYIEKAYGIDDTKVKGPASPFLRCETVTKSPLS